MFLLFLPQDTAKFLGHDRSPDRQKQNLWYFCGFDGSLHEILNINMTASIFDTTEKVQIFLLFS